MLHLHAHRAEPDRPARWSVLTINETGAGRRIAIRNMQLCPNCTAQVRATVSQLSAAHLDEVTA